MQKVIPTDATLIPDNANRVFEGVMFDVYQWPQTMFDGRTETFEMLKRADTMQVIAIHDGKILMIDDEQPHLDKQFGFPGGRVDPTDESWETAAMREMLEETGFSFMNWKLIWVSQPQWKNEWFVATFLAYDAHKQHEPKIDKGGEKITIKPTDFADVKAFVNKPGSVYHDLQLLFNDLVDVEQLKNLPEFTGKSVDR